MKKSTLSWPTLNEWNEWYESTLGQRLLALEQQQLDHYLAKVFGYYAICLGPQQPLSLDNCSVLNKIELAPEFSSHTRASVLADFSNLPFANQSIDLFILPHVLEFSPNPEAILKEVARCLIPNGHVFVLGFNAGSFFGLWRWLQGHSKNFPWRGKFHSLRKLRRWLSESEFTMEGMNTFYFRPPFQHPGPLKKLKFLEVLGPLIFENSGGGYAMLARKELAGLTPIREFKKIVSPIKNLAAVHREQL